MNPGQDFSYHAETCLSDILRACNNTDSITLNNTYLNIVKILFQFFFQFKEHQNRILTSNINLEKRVILRVEFFFLEFLLRFKVSLHRD